MNLSMIDFWYTFFFFSRVLFWGVALCKIKQNSYGLGFGAVRFLNH